MEWRISHSTVKPDVFDTKSSRVYNYMRRNIETREIEDATGKKTIYYVYEEIKVKKELWKMFVAQEQAKADIEYLMMITEEM